MIKVCIISLQSYKLFHPGKENAPHFSGAELQQYYLGKALVQDGDFSVSFLVGNFSKRQPKQENILIGRETIRLYKTVNCGKRNLLIDGILDFWTLYRAMKQASADIYVIRGGGSFAGKVALLSKYIFRSKFIYSSAHDRDSDGSFFMNHPWYINVLFRFAVRNADGVICQHENQRIGFKNIFDIDARIMPSMHPITQIIPDATPSARKHILWVGRLISWKHPEIFIQLAERFPRERFLLITNSKSNNFIKIAKKYKNVTMLENIPLQQMDRYFKEAKLFVNTSTSEGFPNTFIQAAKNATPILSLNVNPNNMLERHGAGICANGKIPQLEAGVDRLLTETKLWHTIAQDAYTYAREHHDISMVARRYKKYLREIL